MDVKIINPFITACVGLFSEMASLELTKSNPELGKGRKLISGYGVVIGITGGVQGQVLYEFPVNFAESITEKLNEKKRNEFSSEDEFHMMIEGTINELGNMISGKAITLLSGSGIDCDITPPQLIKGKDVQVISPNLATFVVPFQSPIGFITINVAVSQK